MGGLGPLDSHDFTGTIRNQQPLNRGMSGGVYALMGMTFGVPRQLDFLQCLPPGRADKMDKLKDFLDFVRGAMLNFQVLGLEHRYFCLNVPCLELDKIYPF